jgi:hypothetical protein
MISCAHLIPAALDEAAAIVEAEWMRLQQQVAAGVDDHYAEPQESPVPQVRPPRVALGSACMRRPGPPSLTGMACRLIPRAARIEVWATERSPPGESVSSYENVGGDDSQIIRMTKPLCEKAFGA